MNTENTEFLFSYGTLQYETVQLSTFGRKLNGTPDTLIGYRLSQLQIKDPNVVALSGTETHPILTYTGNKEDKVSGTVFAITNKELELSDKYEVAEYKRIQVQLCSGLAAWVYINAAALSI